jgi:nitroimidazol reductase NimA-like FMN-containing flavoprotein (pyridoxamine 5'-phosphate oxidase superfamily)
MTDQEAWSFIRTHPTMILSTLDAYGFPHAAPIWYVVINDRIFFRAQPYKKKVKNILRRPQVCGVIEDGEKYSELRGVMIQGLAKIVDNDKQRRKQVFSMLADKYADLRDTSKMPRAWQEKYGKEHRVVIEFTPTNIISWDNRKWVSVANSQKKTSSYRSG